MSNLPRHRRPIIEAIEPRLLFSATADIAVFDDGSQHVDALMHAANTLDLTQVYPELAHQDQPDMTLQHQPDVAAQDTPIAQPIADAAPVENIEHTLVFVDTHIANYAELVKDIQNNPNNKNIEVIYLDANQDGIQQISQALAGYTNVAAIHLLSHSVAGELQLGTSVLTEQSVNNFSAQLASWQTALSADADILIYGCDLTANSAGIHLIEQLSTLTGADIQASNDVTGNNQAGADWLLETSVGNIETASLISADQTMSWEGSLADVTHINTGTPADPNTTSNPVSTTSYPGQTYQQGTNFDVDRVSVMLKNVTGVAAQTITVEIRLNSSNGTLEASSSISSNSLSTTFAWVNFDFTQVTLAAFQTHFIIIKSTGTDGLVRSAYHPSNVTATGNYLVGSNGDANKDLAYALTNVDNHAPTVANAIPNQAATEDSAFSFQFASNSFNDVDAGNTLTYSALLSGGGALPSWLTFTSGTRTFSGTPLNANVGTLTIDVTANDGNGGTVTDTFDIVVANTNDAPTGANATLTAVEDTNYTFSSANFGFSDVDVGDSISAVRIDTLPAAGTLTLSGNAVVAGDIITTANIANLVFKAAANGNGASYTSFTFSVRDQSSVFDTTPNTITFDVTAVNDTPVAVADTIALNEGATATTLVGGATSVLTNDTDVDGNAITAILVTNVIHGNLTLNANGTFSYTHDGGETTTDSFTYKVNDGTVDGNTVTVSINITPVNDPPVAVADTVITLSEGGTATTLVGGATSVLTNDTDAEGNALTAVLVSNVSNGSLTLNADGTFSYTHNGSETTTDSFTYRANDGTANGNTVTVSINITPVNDAPVAVADTVITLSEGATATSLVGGATSVLTNDTDAEGNALTAVLVSNVSNGSLTLNANGTFSYTHNGGETTTDSFTYRANDGTVDGNTVTVNINITPVNDIPVAVADTVITLNEGATATSLVGGATSVLTNDSDADGNPITAILVTNVIHGNLTLNANGTFSYTHDGGETTTDSFTYKVNDGTVDGNTVTVSINITPVNDPPVAVADTVITLSEGGTATTLVGGATSVLTNDTDAEGNALTAVLVSNVSNGSLTLNANGTFSYTHNGGETTTDSFTYRANDGTANGNTVTVSINITPVNDAPIAVADTVITLSEGATATSLVGGATSVLTNDTDAEGNALTAVLVSNVSNGSLTLNANGTFSYTHNGGETTTDSFTYRANDGTVNGNTVTVSINITPVNDAPVAVADTVITLNEGATATSLVGGATSVLTNDTDAEGNALTAVLVSNVSNGSLTLNANGTFSYTHNGGETTTDSFTYKVNDGTVDGNTVTVSINITPVNDLPVTVADTVVTVNEGGTVTTLVGGATSVLTNDTDAEGNALTAVLVSNVSNGSLTLNADGTFSYTHNGSETTTDSFTYRANDGTANGNTVTVSINITPVNDAPVAVADTVITLSEGATATSLVGGATSVLTNDTDAEGNALTAVLVSNVSNGSLTLNANGTFSYTHNGGETTTDSFTYRANDGTVNGNIVTVSINITPVNDAPVAVADTVITLNEGATATSLVGGATSVLTNDSDADGNAITAILVSNVSNGSLTLNSNGTFSYTHNGGETTTDSFTYKVNDGTVDGNTVTVSINITPVNDLPIAVADTVTTVNEGGTVTTLVGGATSVLTNDTDADGNALTAVLVSNVSNGSLTLNADGTFSYTHNGSETTTDSFTYRANDGTANGNTVTVNINITPQNDTPTVTNGLLDRNATRNSVFTYQFASNTFNDVDLGDTLTYTSQLNAGAGALPSWLTFTSATRTFSGTPLNGDVGTLTIDVTADDGHGGTVTDTFSLVVAAGANTVPTIANAIPNQNATEDAAFSFSFAANTFDDSDLDPLTYTAEQSDGNSLPAWLNFDSATRTFSGTPLNANVGILIIEVTADDGRGGTVTDSFTITTANTNDAPVAVTDTLITLNEGGTATSLVGGATSVLTNDSDMDGNAITAILVSNVSNGSLTLNSNGTFSYTHNGGETTTDSFTYKVNDGTVDGNTVTVNINITPVNDLPVAVADTIITLNEGATATSLVGGATSVLTNDSDADGNPISAILVSNVSNGSLILNPNGTFSYTHNGGQTTTDSFTYKVNDGTVDGNTVTVSINITGVNDVPVAVADTVITVNEGATATSLVGGATSVLTNDTDADGDTLTAILVSNVSNGSLTLNSNGTFSYTHNGGETTSDSFTYKVNDGTVDGNTVTVSINVTAVNDAPVAVADTLITLNEGATATSLVGGATSVLTNDTDAEGNALTAVLVSNVSNGSLTLNANGTFSYTHNGGETTTDSFTYRANDGTVNGNIVTVSINITAVNDPPVAVADTVITLNEGATATSLVGGATSVLTNDTDAEGNALTAVLVSNVSNGSLTLNSNGTFSYTHNGSETTTDSFTYKVNDGTVDGNTVTVSINITAVNDPPVAVADTLITLNEGATATSLVGGATSVLANDTDAEGNALTAVLVSNVSNGSLTLNSNGTFSYTHNGGETTSDSFTYKVNDGTVDGNTVTVSINITPVNDPPVATGETLVTLNEGATATTLVGGASSVLTNDSDADGNPLTAILVSNVSNGSLTFNSNGTFSYTHNGSETTTDSFTYKVNDGTVDGNTVTVNINITPVNDLPVAMPDTVITLNEGATATSLVGGASSVLTNDIDAENDPLTAILVSNVSNGSLILNSNGTFSYTHNGGETTTDSFTYKVNDGTANGNTITVSINITPVNDPPVAVADTVITLNEGATATSLVGGATSVLTNDTDAEGNALSAVLVSNVSNGSLTLNSNGTFSYTHNGSETTVDSFTYKVNDGTVDGNTITVSINITPVNDAPVAVVDSVITLNEGATATTLVGGASSVLTNDSDAEGNPLTAILVSNVSNGSLTFNSNGTFSYTHNGGETTTDSFTYKVNDGTVDGNTVTVSINITPVNDSPIAVTDTVITLNEGGTATSLVGGATSVLANDTDAEGSALTAILVSNVSNGSLTFNSNGSFSYTHNGTETTTDSFSYKVNDGTFDGNTVTVNINITPVNDVPVAVADTLITLLEGGTATTLVGGASSVLTNDIDAEGNALTAILVSNVSNGSLTLNSNGTFSYTHNGTETTTDSFTYKVNDGTVDGNTVTVNINITPVNDAPIAVADTIITVNEGGTATTLVGGASSVLANDSDAEGNALTAILVSNVSNGSLTLNSNGTFSYIHNGGETTTDSFTYKVNDGTVDGNTVTVSINITPVNDPPIAMVDTVITLNEGATATSLVGGATSVLTNDIDAEGNALTAVLVSNVSNGNLTLNADGTFSYTHNGTETTTDSFTYRAYDGIANGNIVTVTINITPVNDAPVAVTDTLITLNEGATATTLVGGASSVLTNDSDADGNPFTAILVSNVSNGSLTLNSNGTFSYTHDGSETTTDSFTYKVNDGTIDGNTVTVNINITPANDPPVAMADTLITLNEGATETTLVGGATSLLTNDTDVEGNPLTAILVSNVSHGSLTLNSNGTFSYTHDGSETITDSFTYKVNDGAIDGNTVTVNINITPVNDSPVATGDTLINTINGGTTTSLVGGATSVLSNDTDAEGNALTAILVTNVSNGSLTFNSDGTFSYSHNNSATTTDSFTYKVNDGTIDGNTVTVNINIVALDVAPVAISDTVITLNEGATATSLVGGATSVLSNDSDPDGDPITAILVSNVSHGSLTLNSNGTFSYTHDGSETTSDSFTYKVNDGTVDGNTVSVSINITGVNDLPTIANAIANQNATEGSAFSFQFAANTFKDADLNDTLTYTSQLKGGGALPSWLSFDAGTRTFTGTPLNANVGTLSIDVTANDGNGGILTDTFDITVANTNDAPTLANAIPNQTATEGSAFSFQFAANSFIDIDAGSTLSYSALTSGGSALPTWLHFDAATRTFSGTPLNANVGSLSIDVTANDGNGGTVTDSFDIVVANINNAPILANSIADQTATEDSAFSFQFAANSFIDIDAGNTLSYSALTSGGSALPAWLHFDAATRTFSGTPLNANVGSLSIDVTANDGNGGTQTDTFNITVVNTNDAPILANAIPNQTVNENTAFSFQFSANSFSDVDSQDTLTYSARISGGNTLPTWLHFNAATRSFSGIPSSQDIGNITLELIATDSQGLSATAIFTIDVASSNHAPTTRGIPNLNTFEDNVGDSIDLFSAFSDQENLSSQLTYSLISNSNSTLVSTATINATTGKLQLGYGADQFGSSQITVRATDTQGLSVDTRFTVNVASVNDVPEVTVINSPGNIDNTINVTQGVSISKIDLSNVFHDVEDGNKLVYSLVSDTNPSLTKSIQVDKQTGIVTLNYNQNVFGTAIITLRASDSDGGFTDSSFTINIEGSTNPPNNTNTNPNNGTIEPTVPSIPPENTNNTNTGTTDGTDNNTDDIKHIPTPIVADNHLNIDATKNTTSTTAELLSLHVNGQIDNATENFDHNRYDRIVQQEVLVKKTNDALNLHPSISTLISPSEGFSAADAAEFTAQVKKIHREMEDTIQEEQQQKAILSGITLSITTGLLIWSLRASSLLLALMSMMPLWRGIDPLPILAEVDKRKKELEQQRKDKKTEDTNVNEVGYLFDKTDSKKTKE